MSAFTAQQRRSSLALDLGTTTGYAIAVANGAIASGTVSFKPSRYDGGGIRYLRFRAWLDSMAQDVKSQRTATPISRPRTTPLIEPRPATRSPT